MTWVKLDDRFFLNPKVSSAGLQARSLYLAGLCYCAGGLTDGYIPKPMVRKLAALADVEDTEASASVLVGLCLWEVSDRGYQVHDYLDYNPSREDAEKLREARALAGRLGGQHSGETRRRKTEASASAFASDENEAKTKPVPSRPRDDHSNNDHPDHVGMINPKPPARKRASTEQAYSPEFEQFWSPYPRKDGKWAAWLEWGKRLKGGETPMRLIAASVNLGTAVDADANWEIGRVWHARTFIGPQRLYQDYVAGVPETRSRGGNSATPGLIDSDSRSGAMGKATAGPSVVGVFAKYGQRETMA